MSSTKYGPVNANVRLLSAGTHVGPPSKVRTVLVFRALEFRLGKCRCYLAEGIKSDHHRTILFIITFPGFPDCCRFAVKVSYDN